jgi:hypothetical protein
VQSELTHRRDTAKNKQAEESNRIRADRAEVYRFKTMNPALKFDFSGPTVKVANPASGQITDTGISTGSMTDADKMALSQEHALERIGATGEEARKTEGVRQEGRIEAIGARGEESRRTKGTPSATLTNKGETPTQTKVRQYNAAREFAARNPTLAKFIKFGKSNEFTISPPSKGGFFSSAGPTVDQHAAITKAIFGDALPISQPERTGATPAETPKVIKQYSPSRNQTRISKDGGKTWKVVEGRQ